MGTTRLRASAALALAGCLALGACGGKSGRADADAGRPSTTGAPTAQQTVTAPPIDDGSSSSPAAGSSTSAASPQGSAGAGSNASGNSATVGAGDQGPGSNGSSSSDASATGSSDSSGGSESAGGHSCAEVTQQQAFEEAVGKIKPVDPDRPWVQSTDEKTYDPCAALSWIVIAPQYATGSTPQQIMLFHDGVYIGTTLAEPQPFTPEVTRVSDTKIKVVYTYRANPDESTGAASGRATAYFRLKGDKVVQTGDLPPKDR